MIAIGTITLPDGRRLCAMKRGVYEWDTNAWVADDMVVTDEGTGEELDADALNTEVVHEGITYYLHEFIGQFAVWTIESRDSGLDWEEL